MILERRKSLQAYQTQQGTAEPGVGLLALNLPNPLIAEIKRHQRYDFDISWQITNSNPPSLSLESANVQVDIGYGYIIPAGANAITALAQGMTLRAQFSIETDLWLSLAGLVPVGSAVNAALVMALNNSTSAGITVYASSINVITDYTLFDSQEDYA